jgi:hypothetical protein
MLRCVFFPNVKVFREWSVDVELGCSRTICGGWPSAILADIDIDREPLRSVFASFSFTQATPHSSSGYASNRARQLCVQQYGTSVSRTQPSSCRYYSLASLASPPFQPLQPSWASSFYPVGPFLWTSTTCRAFAPHNSIPFLFAFIILSLQPHRLWLIFMRVTSFC